MDDDQGCSLFAGHQGHHMCAELLIQGFIISRRFIDVTYRSIYVDLIAHMLINMDANAIALRFGFQYIQLVLNFI